MENIRWREEKEKEKQSSRKKYPIDPHKYREASIDTYIFDGEEHGWKDALFCSPTLCVYTHTLYDRYILLFFVPSNYINEYKASSWKKRFLSFLFFPSRIRSGREDESCRCCVVIEIVSLLSLPSSFSYYRKSQKSIEWKEKKKKKSPIKRADRPLGCLSFLPTSKTEVISS